MSPHGDVGEPSGDVDELPAPPDEGTGGNANAAKSPAGAKPKPATPGKKK